MTANVVARFATEAERARWDELILGNPGGGEVWAAFQHLDVKRVSRYLPRYVVVERVGESPIAVGVLAKKVPLLGEWWNLMAGPDGDDLQQILQVSEAVATLARANGAFLMKIEPRVGREAESAILAAGYRKTQPRIPNVSTVLFDVSRSEEDMLAGISKKARNAISRAGREGIRIKQVDATDENCATFYTLLEETAEGRFPLRPAEYFRSFWQKFAAAGQGQMFFAYGPDDDELLAGAFALHFGDTSEYKDGASLRVKKAYGVSHAVQWEILKWAHARGAKVHDMCGTPPSDRVHDETHELFGVGRFKRSFEPHVTDYVGAFERPLKPLACRIWDTIGERIARRVSLAHRSDPYY